MDLTLTVRDIEPHQVGDAVRDLAPIVESMPRNGLAVTLESSESMLSTQITGTPSLDPRRSLPGWITPPVLQGRRPTSPVTPTRPCGPPD